MALRGSATGPPTARRHIESTTAHDIASDEPSGTVDRTLSPRAERVRRERLEGHSKSRNLGSQSKGQDHTDRSSQEDLNRIDSLQEHGLYPPYDPSQHRRSVKDARAAQRESQMYRPGEQADDTDSGCFGFLRKKRTNDSISTTTSPRLHESKASLDGPAFIKQGGGGVVPGTDAPKSAVNAGDRHITIEYNRSYLEFPVDVATTASDLLVAAAKSFSDPIEPKTFALLEHFAKAGVQRPLRRYERVRDVMNSWDDDLVNTLVAVPAAAVPYGDPASLHTSTVPRAKPAESSFVLYHSQKVGKWNKRHITINIDGQVVARKSPSDKEGDNLCHLSLIHISEPTRPY